MDTYVDLLSECIDCLTRKVLDIQYMLNMLQVPQQKIWTSVAKFIVPDGGDKVDSGMVLSYRPTRLHGRQAGTTTDCRSQLYPPFRNYEFGYWSQVQYKSS